MEKFPLITPKGRVKDTWGWLRDRRRVKRRRRHVYTAKNNENCETIEQQDLLLNGIDFLLEVKIINGKTGLVRK